MSVTRWWRDTNESVSVVKSTSRTTLTASRGATSTQRMRDRNSRDETITNSPEWLTVRPCGPQEQAKVQSL